MKKNLLKLLLCRLFLFFICNGSVTLAAVSRDIAAVRLASEITSTATVLRENYQVLQRDKNDLASCCIQLSEALSRALSVTISTRDGKSSWRRELKLKEGDQNPRAVLLENLPMGGPYQIKIADLSGVHLATFEHILVGDLWILGGQSNMQGVFAPEEKVPPHPLINMQNILDEKWMPATEPIHRLEGEYAKQILGMYQGVTDPAEQERLVRSGPVGGTSFAWFCARELVEKTGVPIGLIPIVLGGPPLDLYNPAKTNEPDNRYRVLIDKTRKAGGRVKGMLWYQGESDGVTRNNEGVRTYADRFNTFVETLRRDLNNPEMPVFTAQICRYLVPDNTRQEDWEMIREAQRQAAEKISNVFMVPTADLDLGDGVHLAPDAQKRLGKRMAYVVLPHVAKGVPPRRGIRLESARFADERRREIWVDFIEVTGKLHSGSRPYGFELRRKSDGQPISIIYRSNFDPANPRRMILKLNSSLNEPAVLYYAPRGNPYVNIVDENDMALPGFGPVDVKLP